MHFSVFSSLCIAAVLGLTGPLAAKTVSFTALFDAEGYQGLPSPFAEQPATLDVVIGIDDAAVPDQFSEVEGLGQSSGYLNAITSLDYAAYGAGGTPLGAWSATGTELLIGDTVAGDAVSIFSQGATGPAPLDTFYLLFEGETNLFSGSGVDVMTTDVLKAMTKVTLNLYQVVGDGAIGVGFAVDPDTIVVTGDTPPAPVPLPAGLPLLLAGLGARGLAKGRTQRA